ncbi:hypothetical protein [Prosthecobacter sp.]|uniref:hypothetical protein n=1 Tax=Prosthecobacter sp. TaxID=1965333 RepID=UPI001D5400AB|nr:hypothetical protein [Prosthecobacter sp.]MCB1278657.1 hypothetical protein [Prosthecobacter sp.]
MNRDLKFARRAWIVALIAFLACFVPGLAGWDMMDIGFALIMLCGMVSLTALITALVFRSRGKQAEALLSGTGEFIVEWSIPPELWREILQLQCEEEKTMKMGLLRIVWFFCVLFGVGFIVFDPDAGIVVGVVMLLLMVMTGLLAKLTPGARMRRLGKAETRVRVGKKCVMLGDELHSWSMPGSWLRDVALEEEDGRSWLRVCYAFITRTGIQEENVLLPVPPSEIPKAKFAGEALAKVKRHEPPPLPGTV